MQGGVPAVKVRYHNLKAAVAQVLGFSRTRVEADPWTAFRAHYDLDALYFESASRALTADAVAPAGKAAGLLVGLGRVSAP